MLVLTLLGTCTAASDFPEGYNKNEVCFLSHGCWGGMNKGAMAKVSAAMAHLAATKRVFFVIAAGDNFYKKGVESSTSPRFISGFEEPYGQPSMLPLPWLMALGNHDYRGNFWAQVRRSNETRPSMLGDATPEGHLSSSSFAAVGFVSDIGYVSPSADDAAGAVAASSSSAPRTGRWHLPHPYYAHHFKRFPCADGSSSCATAGGIGVVVLDCPLLERCAVNVKGSKRCWDSGAQGPWADRTLRRLRRDGAAWLVLVCHYPVHANGPHVNHKWLKALVEPLMRRHGVFLYVNADNHYVQVSSRQLDAAKASELPFDVPDGAEDGVAASVPADAAYFFANSGGGGGYLAPKRTDKGYAKSPHSVFEAMRYGPMLHCVRHRRNARQQRADTPPGSSEHTEMVTTVYDDSVPPNALYKFTTPGFRPGSPSGRNASSSLRGAETLSGAPDADAAGRGTGEAPDREREYPVDEGSDGVVGTVARGKQRQQPAQQRQRDDGTTSRLALGSASRSDRVNVDEVTSGVPATGSLLGLWSTGLFLIVVAVVVVALVANKSRHPRRRPPPV